MTSSARASLLMVLCSVATGGRANAIDILNLDPEIPPTSSSQSICNVNAPSSSRLREVLFPDGRRVTIIGHNHGERNFPTALVELIQNKSRSNEEFNSQLRKLVSEVGDGQTRVHASEDVKWLRSKLSDIETSIRFVAVEDSPDQSEMANLYGVVRLELERELRRRELMPNAWLQPALTIMSGAAHYLKMTQPGKFRSVELIGAESPEAIAVEKQKYADLDLSLKTLKAEADPEYLNRMSQMRLALFQLYPKYEAERHDAEAIGYVRVNAPKKNKESATDWVRSELGLLKATQSRDEHVAETLAARKQTGVYFVGAKHLDSVARILNNKCLAESSKARALEKDVGRTTPTAR